MDPGRRARRECEERLRALVPSSEEVIAVGTAEEIDSLKGNIGSGGGRTFIVLTSARILFAYWGWTEVDPDELLLDEVTHFVHGTQYNCYAIALDHSSQKRLERVPAHRFLWFRWGNARAERSRSQTIFRFSRPGTKLAQALRAELSKRQVPDEVITFVERSRNQRLAGSTTVLRPEDVSERDG